MCQRSELKFMAQGLQRYSIIHWIILPQAPVLSFNRNNGKFTWNFI